MEIEFEAIGFGGINEFIERVIHLLRERITAIGHGTENAAMLHHVLENVDGKSAGSSHTAEAGNRAEA